MKVSRVHAGAAAFVFALASGSALAGLFDTRPLACRIEPPPPAATRSAEAPRGGAAALVKLVTLDLAERKAHTTVTLNRDTSAPPPESVWVRTFFSGTTYGGLSYDGCATDAVELRRPFAYADRVTLTATAPAPRCAEFFDRDGFYYARVYTSTRGPAELHDRLADLAITTATPVVAEWGTGRRPPRRD